MGISGFGALSAFRKAAVLLALLAASTVLAQPVCAAHEHQRHATGSAVTVLAPQSEHGDSCCVPEQAHALSGPYAVVGTPVAQVEPATDAPLPIASTRVAPPALALFARGFAPPRSLAYHARTARILR